MAENQANLRAIPIDQPNPYHMNDIAKLLEEGDSRLGTVERLFPGYGVPTPSPDMFYQRAIELLDKKKKSDPEQEHQAHFNLGKFYVVVGDRLLTNSEGTTKEKEAVEEDKKDYFYRALPHLRQAFQLRPDHSETAYALAFVHYVLGGEAAKSVNEAKQHRSLMKILFDEE